MALDAPKANLKVMAFQTNGQHHWWAWILSISRPVEVDWHVKPSEWFNDKTAWRLVLGFLFIFLMFPLFHTCCHGGATSELYQKKIGPPAFSHYWSTHWERVLPNKNSRRSFFVTSLTVVETLLPKFCIVTGRFFAFQICRVDNKIGWHKWNSLHNWHEWTWRWRRKMCIDIGMSKRASHGS